jgi:signal transduction histidine kinase
MAASETLYERLRRLAIADPKSARIAFLEAFEANDNELPDLLEHLRKPAEARLRQVIANAVRAHPSKQRLFAELVIWQDTETDEFTRRAIVGAMAESDSSAPPRRKDSSGEVLPKEVVDAYRYVSERLRHRLRNTMLSAQSQANRLKSATSTGAANPDILVALAKMNDALLSLSRELEATDADPQHFQQRSIALGDWLRQMDVRYTTRYSSLNLKLVNADGAGVRVLASDYLLETVFWNLWLNAHQAAGTTCTITVIFESAGKDLLLKILDSGQGFSKDMKEVAFQAMFSTKTPGRGRGLLEIQESVERLGGNIRLYEEQPSEYRLQIRLPLEAR